MRISDWSSDVCSSDLKEEEQKTRYSDAELLEFKDLILEKLSNARHELQLLTATLSNPNDNGTDDTAGTYKTLEDGSATLEKEQVNQLAVRQRKFISNLEAARSEEHTSELQSLMRISYAVFCLKKKNKSISLEYQQT